MPNEYKPAKGSALLIPSGTPANPSGKHLFVVLTNPCEGNQHLLVSISSIKPDRYCDPTCSLEVAEHEFIEQQSFVFYQRPKQLPHVGIVKCTKSGLYSPKKDCTAELLEKIRAGIIASPMTPRWAKEYFRINANR
jgi:hypothetical protein